MFRKSLVALAAVAIGLPAGGVAQRPTPAPAPAPAPPGVPRGFGGTWRDSGPFIVRAFTGNHARIGVIVNTSPDPDTDKVGARITGVTPGGPADKAGLQAGDIITRFNGVPLANSPAGPGNKLVELAQALDPGDTVHVDYRRAGKSQAATFVAADVDEGQGHDLALTVPDVREWLRMDGPRTRVDVPAPDVGPLMGEGFSYSFCFGDSWCNLELVALNPDLGAYFGVKDGLLVVKAGADSTLPLKAGDVILTIGGRKPESPSHAMRILRSYDPGETVQIEVMRHGKRVPLSWTMPSAGDDMRRMRVRRLTPSTNGEESRAVRVEALTVTLKSI